MKTVLRTSASSLYEYRTTGTARVLVCSTAPSREVLIDPVCSGLAYRRAVRASVVDALRVTAEAGLLGLDGAMATLDILRGGLSFGVADAIGEVLGTDPAGSFVGTERVPGQPIELTYPRWELGDAQTLVVGDIIGTGSTLTAVLAEALARGERRRCPLRAVLVFTIGSRKGVERLAELVNGRHDRPALTVVALETLFELPDAGRRARYPELPFDLVRSPGNAAPEFERQRLRELGSLFERCAIYDGGVRAFAPSEHARSREAWWAQVATHDVALTDLAAGPAGLSSYRGSTPAASWLDDATAAELHALGRAAWQFAAQTTLADYLTDTLARSGDSA